MSRFSYLVERRAEWEQADGKCSPSLGLPLWPSPLPPTASQEEERVLSLQGESLHPVPPHPPPNTAGSPEFPPPAFLGGTPPRVPLAWKTPQPREGKLLELCCPQHPFYCTLGPQPNSPTSTLHSMYFNCCFCQLFPFNFQTSVFSCPSSSFHPKVKPCCLVQ